MSVQTAQQFRLVKAATNGLQSSFDRIEEAIAAIRDGKMVIVVDDENRENEGDLTIAAEKITPDAINFMAKYGRGLICLAMTPDRLDELEIPLMVPKNGSRFETAFCVGIEARERTTTGISAADRATTVRVAVDPETKPADLDPPGTRVPSACEECRSIGTCRANGGCCGPGPAGWPSSCRSYLRDHERRWLDVPSASTPSVCPTS